MPTLEDFAALQGERFAVLEADVAGLWADLIEVQPLGGTPFNGRQPFSLLFAGPAVPVLPQRTYRLAHARLPELDIFLVPIGADTSGARYQAIFS
jgi:hypothetical protein